MRFFLYRCRHAQRRQCAVYTLNLFQLLIKAPPLDTPLHLSLEHLNSLSRHTVTKTRTGGHTSPLQIIMHLLLLQIITVQDRNWYAQNLLSSSTHCRHEGDQSRCVPYLYEIGFFPHFHKSMLMLVTKPCPHMRPCNVTCSCTLPPLWLGSTAAVT